MPGALAGVGHVIEAILLGGEEGWQGEGDVEGGGGGEELIGDDFEGLTWRARAIMVSTKLEPLSREPA